MQKRLKDALIYIFGWLFIILGLLGLFLPFLQGLLFLFIGLYLLSRRLKWAKEFLRYLQRKYPRLSNNLEKSKKRIKKFFKIR